jgi:hypothetical protein
MSYVSALGADATPESTVEGGDVESLEQPARRENFRLPTFKTTRLTGTFPPE